MAKGRRIITTDTHNCREIVTHGDKGYLIPIKLVAALAVAMFQFIENLILIQAMVLGSRQTVEEKYDVHKVNEVMLREMGVQ